MESQKKKLKQAKNSDYVLMASKNNTKIKFETLGDVELKYVSHGDTLEFVELWQKQISDKDIVTQILFHQLIKPKIDFVDFQKLSSKELENLARAFVNNAHYTFQYFKDTGAFFSDFKQALVTGFEKKSEDLKKTVDKWVQTALSNISDINYALIHQTLIQQTLYLEKSLQEFVNVVYQSIKENIKIFDNFANSWANFEQKYRIDEKKAVEVLQKHHWFMSPSVPDDFISYVAQIGQKTGRQDKVVNELFVKFFEAENWRNLDVMLNAWKNKPLLKKRYKILADCVEVVKLANRKGINVVNVVLPTLITQTDGVLTDYLHSKGIQWDCDYDDWHEKGKTKIGRKTQFRKLRPHVLTTRQDELAKTIFLDIFFQTSQKGKPLSTPFNFHRHKIIHGGNVKYGRKGYMIRIFLFLDFLAHLK